MKISRAIETILFFITIFNTSCQLTLYMQSQIAENFERTTVIKNGQVQPQFQSKIYDNPMICTNGMLKLVQFNASRPQPQQIWFQYEGVTLQEIKSINISVSPNLQPLPIILSESPKGFSFLSGCQPLKNITNQNYYNHVKVLLVVQRQRNSQWKASIASQHDQYEISFLLNCDRYNRHKKFEYGYLFIGLINAAIIIGVAMHSRIWSIRINEKPLRILLTWKRFLFIMILLIAIGIIYYFLAAKQFKLANQIIKYLGLVVAFIFTFICMNQIFYLFRFFKKNFCQFTFYNFRRCEVISVIIALALFFTSLFVENWALYTFLAGCICIGCIKMLYFSSMQQAFYSLAISVCSVTIIAIVLHFILPRSYNDYASQLSSPLFIEVPDLVNNLFKKCSWLPVVDIIVPGVLLSFLRTYDNNFSTGWGGVYTITGNLSFLLSTTLWIGIEALYPFSVPFSLITYSFLLLSICLIAFKRNQLKTLWFGYFLMESQIDMNLLKDDSKQESGKKDQEVYDAIKMKSSVYSVEEDEPNQEDEQEINPKVICSEFKVMQNASKPIMSKSTLK